MVFMMLVIGGETSPHAWSRLNLKSIPQVSNRNISTCVEQTRTRNSLDRSTQKHLHMRGADPDKLIHIRLIMETSPHAWSRPQSATDSDLAGRNISTCVEQTLSSNYYEERRRKHLHMRGADRMES